MGLHEACIADSLCSLKQPLRKPPAGIPGGGSWTLRGGVDSSRVWLLSECNLLDCKPAMSKSKNNITQSLMGN